MLDLHCGLKKKPNFREVKKMKHALRHEYKMVSQFIEQNKQKKYTYNEIKHILGRARAWVTIRQRPLRNPQAKHLRKHLQLDRRGTQGGHRPTPEEVEAGRQDAQGKAPTSKEVEGRSKDAPREDDEWRVVRRFWFKIFGEL